MEGDYVLIGGSPDCSVVLACGMLNHTNGSYQFAGYKNYFVDSINQDGLLSGRLVLSLTPLSGKTLTITGVFVQQGETDSLPYGTVGLKGRDAGAHWFAANVSVKPFVGGQQITIHEFHQEDTNNDSWETNMMDNNSMKSIMIVVVGYVE